MKLESGRAEAVLKGIAAMVAEGAEPVVTAMARRRRDPYRILVSTLLSLRTRDETTRQASERLFSVASDPRSMLRVSERRIATLVYPVGFYRTKAARIREISRLLIERHGGRVPRTMEELLALPGVGRKTANLVLIKGFGLPGICVDTHVHRIANRLGWVRTRTPNETETALRRLVPRKLWESLNDLLVAFGQTRCGPLSPRCSDCRVVSLCERRGVSRSR